MRDGRFWKWKPNVPPTPEVLLRMSEAAPEGWRVCAGGECRQVAAAGETADIVTLRACE